MGKSGPGGEDDVDATGKYLLISVPQFAQDPITGNLMTSYLRLGASSTTWKSDPGGWLAEKIGEHGPPGGHLSPDGKEVDPTGEDPEPIFGDDTRKRVETTGHFLSEEERAAQSAVLHTRGGWRDHSDGNRITTTYGDKVEIIRGNYKLMILGRQDDPEQGVGFDASCQLMEDYGYQSSGVRIEESSIYQDADGNNVWHFQESCEGCVLSENFAGDHYEFSWGKRFESTTGSEHPTELGPTGYPRQNPHIIERTWAEKIEGYTGSAAKPVPEIIETTFVVSQVEVLNAVAVTETTTVTGAITGATTAGLITEITTAGAITELTNVAGAITDTTNATIITEVTNVLGTSTSAETVVGVKTDITTAGAILESTIAPLKAGIELVGAAADISVFGVKAEVDVGILAVELSMALKIAVEISAKIEVFLGAKLELHVDKSANYGLEGEEVTITKKVTTLQNNQKAVSYNIN